MTDFKRRASNALPFKKGAANTVDKAKLQQIKESLQKSIIDNPRTAQKAALLIGMWIEGKSKKAPLKKAG